MQALDEIHPNAWHGIARGTWIAAKDSLAARLDSLTPESATVEVMRLVASLSANGRDGHQFAVPQPGSDGLFLPIRVYEFDEGLTITDALAPHDSLIGARITAIGSAPIEQVLAAIEPLVPRDGPATVRGFRPIFLVRLHVLQGLGLIPLGRGPVELTVAMGASTTTASVSPIDAAAWQRLVGAAGFDRLPYRAAVRYLDARPEPWSFEYLADAGAVYLRCTDIRRVPAGFVGELRDRLNQPDVERLIVDLRQNPGGDNHEYPPVLEVLDEWSAIHPSRLFVLTDRVTFSAASNFATEIEQRTDAVFVGEPMGGGLNFWDDVSFFDLDDLPIPIQVGVSTRYWEKSVPDDPRLTIEPDLAVRVTATDYFADRDPVLNAALAAELGT